MISTTTIIKRFEKLANILGYDFCVEPPNFIRKMENKQLFTFSKNGVRHILCLPIDLYDKHKLEQALRSLTVRLTGHELDCTKQKKPLMDGYRIGASKKRPMDTDGSP